MKIRFLIFSSGNSQSEIRNLKFLFFFCALLFALSFPAEAQQPKKVPRIGFLSGTSSNPRREAFSQGLRELG